MEVFLNCENIWKLNNILLKDYLSNEKIKKNILKIIETNENENTAYQNLWDTAKMKWQFTVINVPIQKVERL